MRSLINQLSTINTILGIADSASIILKCQKICNQNIEELTIKVIQFGVKKILLSRDILSYDLN